MTSNRDDLRGSRGSLEPSRPDDRRPAGGPRLSRPMAEALRTVGPVMSVGFAFIFSLAIGYGIGLVLDEWTGLAPWFTVIFSLIGLAAGVLTVVRVVREAMRGR